MQVTTPGYPSVPDYSTSRVDPYSFMMGMAEMFCEFAYPNSLVPQAVPPVPPCPNPYSSSDPLQTAPSAHDLFPTLDPTVSLLCPTQPGLMLPDTLPASMANPNPSSFMGMGDNGLAGEKIFAVHTSPEVAPPKIFQISGPQTSKAEGSELQSCVDVGKSHYCMCDIDQQSFVQLCQQDLTHLVVDVSKRCCAGKYVQLLTGILYSYSRRVYMPVMFAFMEDDEDCTYLLVLAKLRAICQPASPKYVTCNFLPGLYKACLRTFSGATFIASFYYPSGEIGQHFACGSRYYAHAVWRLGFKTRLCVDDNARAKKMFFDVKALAFARKERLESSYVRCVKVYASEYPDSLKFFGEYSKLFVEGECAISKWSWGRQANDQFQDVARILVATTVTKHFASTLFRAWQATERKNEAAFDILKTVTLLFLPLPS